MCGALSTSQYYRIRTEIRISGHIMIFLPARVREVLDSSGYSHRYAISDYELNEVKALYQKFGIAINDRVVELMGVVGDRVLEYRNGSIPARGDVPYEISFCLRDVLGKSTKTNILNTRAHISWYEERLHVSGLVPVAIMPSGPMTFYLDDQENIYGILDDLVLGYQGRSLWNSVVKLFDGHDTHVPISRP